MLSSKTYLALLVILELAGRGQSEPLTSMSLANRYGISKRYLEVVFGNLAKSGMIASRRGIGGGYYLAVDLNNLTIYNLALAAEGGIRIFVGGEYLSEDGDKAPLINAINAFWNNLDVEIKDRLRARRLADIISELTEIKEMYYI